jgi:hypothetical protein
MSFFDYPTCKYCGCKIFTFDPTATYHSECHQDFLMIEKLALTKISVREWLEVQSRPNELIAFLESVLEETEE